MIPQLNLFLQSIRTPGYRRRIKLIHTFELDGDLGLIQKFTSIEVPNIFSGFQFLYNFTTPIFENLCLHNSVLDFPFEIDDFRLQSLYSVQFMQETQLRKLRELIS